MQKTSLFSRTPRVSPAPAPQAASNKEFQVTIEDIKEKFPIVEYVSQYVKLKRTTGEYSGRCPFHDDTNPSFTVSPEKGTFLCNGCGKTGNVVHFHMYMNDLSKRDAFVYFVRKLKGQNSSFRSSIDELKDRFRNNLQRMPSASEYLKDRGLTEETINKFEIGFCFGKEHEQLSDKAISELTSMGHISEKGWLQMTRRVVFPIRDFVGRTVGFGGRAIDPKQEVKYLNSRESEIFKKGSQIFGANHLRVTEDEPVIIVEGYFDVAMLHQNEVRNVVGIMGTNINSDVLNTLLERHSKLVFCLDPDEAGMRGSLRNIKACASVILDHHQIAFSHVPDGLDPDEYVTKYGKRQFLDLVRGADSLCEFVIKVEASSHKMDTIEGRTNFRAAMAEFAELFENAPLLRDEINNAAQLAAFNAAYHKIMAVDHRGVSPEELNMISEKIASMRLAMNSKSVP